jgi:Na+/H+ antiporter NhaC
MSLLINFSPVLLFIFLFVGTGFYFSATGIDNAFYQISPTVAILPAIALGWVLQKGTTQTKMHKFLDGVRHRDIITMATVFMLAGAFSSVTKAVGSVDSTVQFSLSLVSPEFLLIGLFITAAFIATAVGTSMGTIATIAPIAAGLGEFGAFPMSLGMATVIGGAMFGDNLSLISDTTIAAVSSQEADLKAKFRFNTGFALVASAITLPILYFSQTEVGSITHQSYEFILIAPYIFLIILAVMGINVFIVLTVSLLFSGIVGYFHHDYSIITFCKDIFQGFQSMNEIMLLSLMVGGLSGLTSDGSKELTKKLADWIARHGGKRMAQFVIAKIVSIFDVLLANNVVAIIFSGEIARNIADKYKVPKHVSASWLDIFSCVFQGIIPYGAQILLASSIAGISPLSITPHVYYCYVLALLALGYIAIKK